MTARLRHGLTGARTLAALVVAGSLAGAIVGPKRPPQPVVQAVVGVDPSWPGVRRDPSEALRRLRYVAAVGRGTAISRQLGRVDSLPAASVRVAVQVSLDPAHLAVRVRVPGPHSATAVTLADQYASVLEQSVETAMRHRSPTVITVGDFEAGNGLWQPLPGTAAGGSPTIRTVRAPAFTGHGVLRVLCPTVPPCAVLATLPGNFRAGARYVVRARVRTPGRDVTASVDLGASAANGGLGAASPVGQRFGTLEADWRPTVAAASVTALVSIAGSGHPPVYLDTVTLQTSSPSPGFPSGFGLDRQAESDALDEVQFLTATPVPATEDRSPVAAIAGGAGLGGLAGLFLLGATAAARRRRDVRGGKDDVTT